jgi:hypothetical protein
LKKKQVTLFLQPGFRAVAQPGSALRSGRRGRWFESSLPDKESALLMAMPVIRNDLQAFLFSNFISNLPARRNCLLTSIAPGLKLIIMKKSIVLPFVVAVRVSMLINGKLIAQNAVRLMMWYMFALENLYYQRVSSTSLAKR